jgi:D-sedoheptulose 7-phosphate isomerase
MGADDPAARVDALFGDTIALHERARAHAAPLLRVAEALRQAFERGGKALVFGNGGSAADAQHFAAELVGRYSRNRQAVAAIALSADTIVLTAVGNDYGFERIFARQIEALGAPGDVAIGISTSGRSRNVVSALALARGRGLITIGFTGADGGEVGPAVDIHVNVPHPAAPRVQEVQRTQLHAICELIESELTRHVDVKDGG